MNKVMSLFLASLALTSAALAQDEGDATPTGTRTAAFVVVQAADGARGVYKISAAAVNAGREAVVAEVTPENRIEATIVADEGDIDASRPAWFWCINNWNFGWGGARWFAPVYSWTVPYYSYGGYSGYGYSGYNFWVYRWVW